MKHIPLTQGQFALVDDEDYSWLMQWKWCARWNKTTSSFYAIRGKTVNKKQITVLMHRKILGLTKGDGKHGDHRNHDTLDNRRSNIRTVTHQFNQWNRKNPKGYVLDKSVNRYMSRIRVNTKSIYLGHFDTTTEAHNAYLEAKKIYHPM